MIKQTLEAIMVMIMMMMTATDRAAVTPPKNTEPMGAPRVTVSGRGGILQMRKRQEMQKVVYAQKHVWT